MSSASSVLITAEPSFYFLSYSFVCASIHVPFVLYKGQRCNSLGKRHRGHRQVFGVREFFTSQESTTALSGVTCTAAPAVCKDAISFLAGYNPQNLNSTQLALYDSYVPAGTPCLSSLPYPSLGALLAPRPRMCINTIIFMWRLLSSPDGGSSSPGPSCLGCPCSHVSSHVRVYYESIALP